MRFFHYNSIVIAAGTLIGKDVSIHQGVTLDRVFNGPKVGVQIIGDKVTIFAGAKVIGKITIGKNVVIGANSVVTRDMPDNCVCAGNPAKAISEDSTKCFDEEWSKEFAQK